MEESVMVFSFFVIVLRETFSLYSSTTTVIGIPYFGVMFLPQSQLGLWGIKVTPQCLLEIFFNNNVALVPPYILWANGMKGRHCLTFRISTVSTGAYLN